MGPRPSVPDPLRGPRQAGVRWQCPAPAEQQNLAVPSGEVLGKHAVGLRTTSEGDQPGCEQESAEAQAHTGQAVDERQQRGQLKAVILPQHER